MVTWPLGCAVVRVRVRANPEPNPGPIGGHLATLLRVGLLVRLLAEDEQGETLERVQPHLGRGRGRGRGTGRGRGRG